MTDDDQRDPQPQLTIRTPSLDELTAVRPASLPAGYGNTTHVVELNGDVGVGRLEFVRALQSVTGAWRNLLARSAAACRDVTLVDEVAHDDLARLDLAERVADGWVQQWHTDCDWLRHWAYLAALPVFHRHWEPLPGQTPITSVLHVPGPRPDIRWHLHLMDDQRLLQDWQPHEHPPDGGLSEPKKAFMARMDDAFEARARVLQTAVGHRHKRALREHAEWTARFQVGLESGDTIWASTRLDDRRAVPKAIEAFAALIDLPLREKPTTSTAVVRYL